MKLIGVLCLLAAAAPALPPPPGVCMNCHSGKLAKGGLDLAALSPDLSARANRDRWIRLHDRVEKGEMPPAPSVLDESERAAYVKALGAEIQRADAAEIAAEGRGPLRRLNRNEYEQNLRDILRLPHLDIRDMLPEDRESHHFNKTAEALDMSRVQLTAYLDAAEAALRQAMVTAAAPPPISKFRAVGTRLFYTFRTTGEKQSMFFAKHGKPIDMNQTKFNELRKSGNHDPEVELALFRSVGWPFASYPMDFKAALPGEYRVRFSAKAVTQGPNFTINPGNRIVSMNFRSRKPTSHDIAEDTKVTGATFDIRPEGGVYETTVLLGEGQTIEYSLLGLPVPQVDAIPTIPASYRFPPFPEGGAPGMAVQWLEIEGPLPPPEWPPASHHVLFDRMGPDPQSKNPKQDASRLLRRFVKLAARGPVPEEAVRKFESLIHARLDRGESFSEALLGGYQAFLCSSHFLYLPEPIGASSQFAIASRLSHFLTDTRPDAKLSDLARKGRLRDPNVLASETERLIASGGFDRFVKAFTDSWLSLRHIRRDDPDIRLYPEYRMDEYLVDSLESESRMYFTALIRDNLPARSLVESDFVFANERLARHYRLPAMSGSPLRKVTLPEGSPLGGFLTQGAILKITANGTSTSPVLRGAWIMDRIIGQPPPPPPPGVPAVEPDIRGAKTIRDLLALHTKSATCAACHARFDPVGLALENFDVVGGWRDRYRGTEGPERVKGIDRSGHDFNYAMAGAVDSSGKLLDGRSFRDVRELKALFAADSRQLARNLLRQFIVYSTGTPVRFADRAEVESMLDECEPGGYRVRDLLVALVRSKIFLGTAGGK